MRIFRVIARAGNRAAGIKHSLKHLLFALSFCAAAALPTRNAAAHTTQHTATAHHLAANHHTYRLAGLSHHSRTWTAYNPHRYHHLRYASARYRPSYLQCVPYAREVSHINLSGNAFLWWAEAAGRYARGNTPVEGAVLNFRSVRRMPLGHVAVVTSVIDNRTVLVTQANWVRGTITNDVTIEDVSPNNDWTQVQVELGDGEKMGAAYPTYGFIYNQPATITFAGNGTSNEVAEAPRPAPLTTEAPNRNLQ